MDLQMDPSGHMILLEKVTEACDKLNRSRLIRYNKNSEQVYSTDMGRIASNYYIDVETMSYFMANLRSTTRDTMLLYHLAQATEFKQLDARKEEYEELKILVADSRIVEVDKATFNEAHTKVLVLFEAYLKQRVVKTFSLISDMAYVVNNAARLLRAMFEIALKKNYAGLLKSTLKWCQILDKRLIPGQHILRHFTKDASVGKLTNQNAKTTNYGYLKDDIVYRVE
jgi:replicative superfamily II helicase